MAKKYAYSEPEQALLTSLKKHDMQGSPLLLAISGGSDSMALWQAAHHLGLQYAVAYLHHGLRPEADEDVKLVQQTAQVRNVICHIEYAQVGEMAEAEKRSTQDMAREVRYAWLNRLARQQGYAAILTAHHAQDQAETLLLHLLRGTGWPVLQGIGERWGVVIRPWLSLPKASINAYVRQHHISYLEDASNSDDHYLRNYLRLHVLPHLAHINPSYRDMLAGKLEQYGRQLEVLNHSLDSLLAECSTTHRLNLQPAEPHATLLYYWLSTHPLTEGQKQEVLLLLDRQPGTRVEIADKGHYIRETEAIVWQEALPHPAASLPIDHLPALINWHGMSISLKPASTHTLAGDAHTAYLATSLTLPLTLRCWQQGDRIRLMGGPEKKVSDVLTDAKVPSAQRAGYWVLVDADGDILYLQGQRVTEKARVPEQADACWQLSWSESAD